MNKKITQNILLVDDRPENLLALESVLEEPDRNFIKATSGKQALGILLKNDVSLILLDVQMPEMDGFETATFIRGSNKTKHIPIIFISAISKEEKHVFNKSTAVVTPPFLAHWPGGLLKADKPIIMADIHPFGNDA